MKFFFIGRIHTQKTANMATFGRWWLMEESDFLLCLVWFLLQCACITNIVCFLYPLPTSFFPPTSSLLMEAWCRSAAILQDWWTRSGINCVQSHGLKTTSSALSIWRWTMIQVSPRDGRQDLMGAPRRSCFTLKKIPEDNGTTVSCLQAAAGILWQWGKPFGGGHQSREYQTEELIKDKDLHHWWVFWVSDYASHAALLWTSCPKRQCIFL